MLGNYRGFLLKFRARTLLISPSISTPNRSFSNISVIPPILLFHFIPVWLVNPEICTKSCHYMPNIVCLTCAKIKIGAWPFNFNHFEEIRIEAAREGQDLPYLLGAGQPLQMPVPALPPLLLEIRIFGLSFDLLIFGLEGPFPPVSIYRLAV